MAELSKVFRVPERSMSGEPIRDAYYHVRFYWDASPRDLPDGQRVFDKVLMARNELPGGQDHLDREMKRIAPDGVVMSREDYLYRRFGTEADAWEADNATAFDGTPLSVLSLDPATEANFGVLQVRTVEALAGVPDASIGNLGMGALAARERAQRFLAVKEGSAPMLAMERRAADQEAEMEALRAEVAALREASVKRRGT